MKNIVIVDIDGTVSKVGDRLKYLQQEPKDWDSFYNACFDDEPIWEICELVRGLDNEGYVIWFCTGRRESVRQATIDWIKAHIYSSYIDDEVIDSKLVMRPDNDKRHDTIVKPEQLSNQGILLQEIAFVLEDRNSMVKKWRALGLKCLQVAEGDF